MGNEWPLVIFTVIAQLGIGLLVMAYIAKETLGESRKKVLTCVVLCTAVSMLISVSHLGDPVGAHRAIFNLQHSWLSREIFLLGGFFASSLFVFYMLRQSSKNIPTYSLIAVLLGVSTVISMGNIYYVSSILAWMNIYTHILFLTSTLISGGSFLAVLVKGDNEQSKKTLKKIIGVNSILFVVQILSFVTYFAYLTNVAQSSATFFVNHMSVWLFGQGSLFCGVLAGFWGVKRYIENSKPVQFYFISGFVLTMMGIIVIRYMFYASGSHMW